MATIGEAIIQVRGDTSRLTNDIRSGTSSSKMGKLGKMAGKGLAIGFTAAFAGAVAGGAFLKDAIARASDFEESATKVGVVFGKQAGRIKAFSKDAATSVGMSSEAYLAATGTLGNLLVSLDLAPKKAADMSQEMVALAGDLASFNNASPEETLLAIRAGLVGETEPLKRFGVNMNEATLRAEALKMGLVATTKEALDPQTKALAAQSLIMSQTGTAQGDFQRTSKGLANQQRILAAQFDDLKVKVGTKFLPVATKAFNYLTNTAMPALSKMGPHFTTAKEAIAPVVERLSAFFRTFSEGGGTEQVGKLRETFVTVFEAIKSVVQDAVTIVSVIWKTHGETILRYTRSTFSNIMQAIKGAFQIIQGLFKVVGALLKGDWRGVWDGIKLIVRGAWNLIGGVVKQGWNTIRTIFTVAGKSILAVYKRIWETIKSTARAAGNAIAGVVRDGMSKAVGFVRDVPGKIRGIASSFLSAGKKLGSSVIDGIKSGISATGGLLSSIPSQIKSAINGALNLPITLGKGPLKFTIPAFARGTNFAPGGTALVGEEGPELVDLPRGSKVITAARTRAMARSVGGTVAGAGRALRVVSGTLAADSSVGIYLRDLVVEEIDSADAFAGTMGRMN